MRAVVSKSLKVENLKMEPFSKGEDTGSQNPIMGVLAIFFHWYLYRNRYHALSLKHVIKKKSFLSGRFLLYDGNQKSLKIVAFFQKLTETLF